MKISVIGLGYLGAVTAASFANLGHQVIAIDRDDNKINDYIEKFGNIHEPGLKKLIQTKLRPTLIMPILTEKTVVDYEV